MSVFDVPESNTLESELNSGSDDRKFADKWSHSSLSIPSVTSGESKETVAILGTGIYGRALEGRLRAKTSLNVLVGSRTPKGDQVYTLDAVKDANVVFFALPHTTYRKVVSKIASALKPGTVVVDISNSPLSQPQHSHEDSRAEYLQSIVPDGVHVAKAFNTVSVQEVETRSIGNSPPAVVHVACNDSDSVERISRVVASMGLIPIYNGDLTAARELESQPHRLFPRWRRPVIVSVIVFLFWLGYKTLTHYVLATSSGEPKGHWASFPLNALGTTAASTSMTLFSLTFLPGPIATFRQLRRGSVSKPFGRFFGAWLGMRKELGVLAFYFASVHVLVAVTRGSHIKTGALGSAYYALGVVSYMLFGLLIVSSLKDVSSRMSWSEARTVFSWVGIAGLLVGALHLGLLCGVYQGVHPWREWPARRLLLPTYWLGLLLPVGTLALRLVAWSPCAVKPLRRLRGETARMQPRT